MAVVGAWALAGVAMSGARERVRPRHHGVSAAIVGLGRRGSVASGAQLRESVLRVPHAVRGQAPASVGAQLPWMRRAQSDTFAAGDGRLVTRIYPVAVNYRDGRRGFAPINSRLVASAGGFVQQANDLGVVLPRSASAAARVAVAGGRLSFELVGASGGGSVVSASQVRYAASGSGVRLAYGSLNDGVGWEAALPASAHSSTVRWRLGLSRGLSASLSRSGVAVRNARGRVVWVFRAPSAHLAGSGRALRTRLSLRRGSHGVVVVSVRALTKARAGARRFASYPVGGGLALPVGLVNANQLTFDGQVIQGTAVSDGTPTGSCYLDSGSPDSSFCDTASDLVGPTDHTLLNFDVADNMPSHVTVLGASVVMEMESETSGTGEMVGVWQAAQPWDNLASWNSYDGTNSWTTPGGDTEPSVGEEDTQWVGGATNTWTYWDIYPSMQGWVDGKFPEDDGLIFQADAGSNAPTTFGFGTGANNDNPYISITYEPRMGLYAGAKYDSQQLTSRSSLGVNVANGNLLLSNTDISLPGVAGLGLSVGRYYNNLSGDQDALGIGWSMGAGADTYLTIPSDGSSTVDYFDGSGNAELFYVSNVTGQTINPPGEDARLSMNVAGDTYDSTSFTLYFRHSGITETFTKPVGFNEVAHLTSVSDRHGNTITYNYTGAQLTSITDSYGNTTSIHWNDGYVSSITYPGPGSPTYYYYQNASGQLYQVKDPAGGVTSYTYDAYGNLTQITTAKGNITQIAYDAGNTNEVTSVQRMQAPGDASSPTSSDPLSSYAFGPASGTCPAANGATQADVKDPDGHVITYCTDDLGRITQTIDGNGHSRSVGYDPNSGFVKTQTSALNTPTTFTYSPDNKDNLIQIEQGNSSGSGGSGSSSYTSLTTKLNYNDPSQSNQYLPSSSTDAQGNVLDYTMDPNTGDVTKTTSNTPGDSTTNGDNVQMAYNADGTVKTSTDANGATTSYYYTNQNLTQVVPPSGSQLNTINLTYDAANRVTQISSVDTSTGTGREVDYSYDAFNQVTQAVYKTAAGATVATITYCYDKDGNLTGLTDPWGDTSYGYDGLNRLDSEAFPDNVSYTYSYDPASNITQVWNSNDNGNDVYAYDKANQLTSITLAHTGKPEATFTYDADGNLTAIKYASGASVAYTYNGIDQLTQVNNTYKTSAGQAAHLTYAYTYTGSQRSQMTSPAGTTTYTYDALNRLTKAVTTGTSPSTDSYTLDPAGNMLNQNLNGTTSSFGYRPGSEICWRASGTIQNPTCGSPPNGADTYGYDADGNQTSNGAGLTATYNALDQMTSATQNGSTTNYTYLGQGQNQLIADGTTTLGNDILGLQLASTGSATTYYDRARSGQIIDERTPTGTYDYLYDGNGSVVGLTDSSAHLANRYAYDPYGNQTNNSTTVNNPFGYDAGYTASTGLTHFGARYLNPSDARWTQQDPLNHITSLTQNNRYTYGGGDPINTVDPSGESVLTDAKGFVCTVLVTGICASGSMGTFDPEKYGPDTTGADISVIEKTVGDAVDQALNDAESIPIFEP